MIKMRLAFACTAAVIAAMTTPASAQSSVTLYGLVDLGIRVDKTASGTVTGLQSGMESGNRFGFRGIEDLGGGLAAVFTLEAGFLADTGDLISNGAPGPGFGRQASVALVSSKWGGVGLGRQYNPIFSFVAGNLDPFGFGFVGSIGNSVGLLAGAPARSGNSLSYSSPVWGGFKADAIYALGETSKPDVPKGAGDQMGLSLVYTDKAFTLGYAYHRTRGTSDVASSPEQVRHVIGGNYDFGLLKLYGSYALNRNDAVVSRIDRAAYSVGVRVPIGAGVWLAQYQVSNDKTAADADSRQVALGYQYFLSKRTDVYAVLAKTDNRNRAAFAISDSTNSSIGTVTPGFDPSAYQIGIRHRF